jgi:hypothetical protein
LDISPPTPGAPEPRQSLWLYRHQNKSYGDSTKHALILVPKLWWSLSIDLFYEKISIRNSFELFGLVKALESNISRAAGTTAVSTYLKDVSMDLYLFSGNEDEGSAFNKLFSMCDNIQILGMYNTYNWHIPVITPRLDTLKFLAVDLDDHKPGFCCPFLKGLNCPSNLQALQILFLSYTGPNGPKFPESLSFPSVHTLGLVFAYGECCDLVMDDIATWELPSLLSAELDLMGYHQNEPLEQFFALHGPKLTSIRIDDMSVPILLIAKHCSRLEDLVVLYCHPQDYFEHFEAEFPQLRRIRFEDGYFSFLGQFLERIYSSWRPLLRKIQVCKFSYDFISEMDVNQAKKMVDDWGRENVRLEDGEGQLLDVSVEAYLNYEDSRANLGA